MKSFLLSILTVFIFSHSFAANFEPGPFVSEHEQKQLRRDIRAFINGWSKLVAIPTITEREFYSLVNHFLDIHQDFSSGDDFNRIHAFVKMLHKKNILLKKQGECVSATSIDVVHAVDFLRIQEEPLPSVREITPALVEVSELDEFSLSVMIFGFFGNGDISLTFLNQFLKHVRDYYVVLRDEHDEVHSIDATDVFRVTNKSFAHLERFAQTHEGRRLTYAQPLNDLPESNDANCIRSFSSGF